MINFEAVLKLLNIRYHLYHNFKFYVLRVENCGGRYKENEKHIVSFCVLG